MKKRFFRLMTLGLIGASVIGFVSCEKETEKTEIKSEIVSKNMNTDYSAYFTNIGEKHNSMLDYVIENCNPSKGNREKRYYLGTEENPTIEWDIAKNQIDKIYTSVSNLEDLDGLINNIDCPEKSKSYFRDLIELFYKMEELTLDEKVVLPKEFNSWVDEIIIEIENEMPIEVDTEKNIGNEASAIIGACYLAKATYSYWYNAATDKNNPWNDYLYSLNSTKECPPFIQAIGHAIAVGAVDTVSFLGGGGQWGATGHGISFNFGIARRHAGNRSRSV